MAMRAMIGGGGGGEGFNSEDLSIYRSGSAPPTMEGSITAMSGLFTGDASRFGRLTEEATQSDPAYLSYYYSTVNLNPRLPPPVMSKEDWRLAQRLQAGSSVVGEIGDGMKADRAEEEKNRSLFSMQPEFVVKEEDGEENSLLVYGSGGWLEKGGDRLTCLTGLPAGRQKTFADLFQNNQREKAFISSHPSPPASQNAFATGVELLKPGEACATIRPYVSSQNDAASTEPTLVPLLGPSLSRSSSPDRKLVAIVHRTNVPPIGVKIGNGDQKNTPTNYLAKTSSGLVDPDYLVDALSGINLSSENIMKRSALQREGDDHHQNSVFNLQGRKNLVDKHTFLQKFDSGQESVSFANQMSNASFPEQANNSPASGYFNNAVKWPHKQVEMHRSYLPLNSSYVNVPSATVNNLDGSVVQCPSSTDHPNASFKSYGMRGYSENALASVTGDHVADSNMSPWFESAVAASKIESIGMDTRVLGGGFLCGANWNPVDLQNPNKIGSQTPASGLHFPHPDPRYIQYLSAVQASTNINEPSLGRGSMSNSYAELIEMKKAYLGALFQPPKKSGLQFFGRYGYNGNPSCNLGMSYPESSVSPVLPASPVGPSSTLRHRGPNMHFPFTMTNFSGNAMGSWNLDNGSHVNDGHASSLLEEFKNNKTKCFELSDIAGHVVEFSADQYGSRFIQQKLETATAIEKDMFFDEILPQAFSLMTDVFGNYVVQKFFEHGSAAQRRELADQLTGHILTLSLQMYGCRVIQKAIEVVDLDQQTKMVLELDGHVMRCVRDQNGNHVIQKCIECIPQDAIQFIISTFYDQVITLSTHPYGCRVVQRILEYCDDPKTQQIMMDEILQCICILAQDQYGNYVVQHVLEHGKPHERSAIIEKLTGQIVYMSQQKFASNVVEKCLIFAGPLERKLLVNEMLGTTEENEPLQAMMKDQFANYVVQKVLETCDDRQRELILSRIKVHLNSLKKYTYGKHIVARVEKLVAAGERRVGVSVM